jgi:hypothetical protein
MLDVSTRSFGRLLLAFDRPLAAMVHGRSAVSRLITSIAAIGVTRDQGEEIERFQTSNTSLEAVEGAPRMITSIRRKTEEQLKLHPAGCRYRSTAALQVLGQNTDGVHLATSQGLPTCHAA